MTDLITRMLLHTTCLSTCPLPSDRRVPSMPTLCTASRRHFSIVPTMPPSFTLRCQCPSRSCPSTSSDALRVSCKTSEGIYPFINLVHPLNLHLCQARPYSAWAALHGQQNLWYKSDSHRRLRISSKFSALLRSPALG